MEGILTLSGVQSSVGDDIINSCFLDSIGTQKRSVDTKCTTNRTFSALYDTEIVHFIILALLVYSNKSNPNGHKNIKPWRSVDMVFPS